MENVFQSSSACPRFFLFPRNVSEVFFISSDYVRGFFDFLGFSSEIMFFTRIAICAKTAVLTKTAILAIPMKTIEICCSGVKRTMSGPGMCGIIDIS